MHQPKDATAYGLQRAPTNVPASVRDSSLNSVSLTLDLGLPEPEPVPVVPEPDASHYDCARYRQSRRLSLNQSLHLLRSARLNSRRKQTDASRMTTSAALSETLLATRSTARTTSDRH